MSAQKPLKSQKASTSATLFKNPFLEKLTHTHIAVPLSIFTIISVTLIYYGIFEKGFQVPFMIVLFFAGLFFFTLIEYLMHRYLYHMHPESEKGKKMAYTMHGVHHEYPKDKSRLAMPPILSLILATVFFIIYRAVMGDYVFGFLAGFLMGYTAYLGIHYSIHTFKPPKNFLKILWQHHLIHHYRETDKAFGVSSPFWDFVFGTMPTKSWQKE